MPSGWTRLMAVIVLMATSLTIGCSDHSRLEPSAPPGWSRLYGGADLDEGYSVKPTTDGGYIIAGYTVSRGNGGADVYLIKTNDVGDTLWTRTFGGPGGDWGRSVQQTTDGGYIVLAECFRGANRECWLIKTDPDGDRVWDRLYGYNSSREEAAEVQQTSDGGYILVGTTDNGGDNEDIWLVKTTATGVTQWYDTKGYSDSNERGASIHQTSDGGYILAGVSFHIDKDAGDMWLVKIGSDGRTEWYRDWDYSGVEYPTSVRQTTDGGYAILCGLEGPNAQYLALRKTNAQGYQLWVAGYASVAPHWGKQVQQTADGGYMVAGRRAWALDDPADFLLIKYDGFGTVNWTKIFGRVGDDRCYSGAQTVDGGYILCGSTDSQTEGDRDVFLIKTDSNGNVE